MGKTDEIHKAGFVNIIGSPNVGKSTLMNRLVGEKLSIITSKAQTTRHRILGIVNGEDHQIVYSDTPGIIKPFYKLHKGMMSSVNTALSDADIMLYMTEVDEMNLKDEVIFEKLRKSKIPLLFVINKIDLASTEKVLQCIIHWKDIFEDADFIPISALKGRNVKQVTKKILEYLPQSPAYFPKDQLTDRPERFFVSEIIRHKIFITYSREIPYSSEVVIVDFEEGEKLVKIYAQIIVMRESQKAIVIGHRGGKLKIVGTKARKDLEEFLDKKVYLDLRVKVNKNWRNNEKQLKDFGYFNRS